MKLTIEQALQQGVAAHKEGKLQDAERIYRAILKSHPTHPDGSSIPRQVLTFTQQLKHRRIVS